MSQSKTSKDTSSTTSSPESAAGASRCAAPDGMMTDLFGQEAAPASPSPAPEKVKVKATTVISGLRGFGSSASINLQSCLESKLRQRLPTAGLMPLPMAWRRKTTPSGRRFYQLALLEPSTEEIEYGLWQTPSTDSFRKRGGDRSGELGNETMIKAALWLTPRAMESGEGQETFIKRMGDRGENCHSSLTAQVKTTIASTAEKTGTGAPASCHGSQAALWKTPKASDGEKGGPNQRGSKGDLALPAQAYHAALWATPNTMDHMKPRSLEALERAKKVGGCSNLKDQIHPAMTMWPTPISRDAKSLRGSQAQPGRQGGNTLGMEIAELSGLNAQTEKQGQLNPTFVCWLMGYPLIWVLTAPAKLARIVQSSTRKLASPSDKLPGESA
jgi:hypothetical protein